MSDNFVDRMSDFLAARERIVRKVAWRGYILATVCVVLGMSMTVGVFLIGFGSGMRY